MHARFDFRRGKFGPEYWQEFAGFGENEVFKLGHDAKSDEINGGQG